MKRANNSRMPAQRLKTPTGEARPTKAKHGRQRKSKSKSKKTKAKDKNKKNQTRMSIPPTLTRRQK
ncbi:prophage tail gpP-like protein [Paraburkholderia caribensis]|nr:prophage tail gpP-like protein [Paraburkholderia caribensis]